MNKINVIIRHISIIILYFAITNIFLLKNFDGLLYSIFFTVSPILLLSKLNIAKTSNVIIHERKVYRDAIADGKGVMEYDNIKAKNEIIQLLEEIFYNE